MMQGLMPLDASIITDKAGPDEPIAHLRRLEITRLFSQDPARYVAAATPATGDYAAELPRLV
jgi:hypothetical protein